MKMHLQKQELDLSELVLQILPRHSKMHGFKAALVAQTKQKRLSLESALDILSYSPTLQQRDITASVLKMLFKNCCKMKNAHPKRVWT